MKLVDSIYEVSLDFVIWCCIW